MNSNKNIVIIDLIYFIHVAASILIEIVSNKFVFNWSFFRSLLYKELLINVQIWYILVEKILGNFRKILDLRWSREDFAFHKIYFRTSAAWRSKKLKIKWNFYLIHLQKNPIPQDSPLWSFLFSLLRIPVY